MAGAFSFNQLSVSQPLPILSSKPSLLSPPTSISFAAAKTAPITGKLKLRVRAVSEDEWGPEPVSGSVAVAEDSPAKEPTETDLLKRQLVDSFYGTDRGLKATSQTRAEVVELITQLEAKNPTPAPTEALTLLNGKWILA